MPNGRTDPWPDERVAKLKRLVADGLSASKIAAALGRGISRNAVCGKADRLGLRINGDPFDHRQNFSRKRATVTKPKHKGPWTPVATATPREALPTVTRREPLVFRAPQPPPEPVSRNLPLTEWTATTCKWIAGEGPAGLACGHPTYQGRPWCEHHARRAYA